MLVVDQMKDVFQARNLIDTQSDRHTNQQMSIVAVYKYLSGHLFYPQSGQMDSKLQLQPLLCKIHIPDFKHHSEPSVMITQHLLQDVTLPESYC